MPLPAISPNTSELTESPLMPPLQVRELFGLYDADGSGELDKDEFIEVLIATGKNGLA